MRQKWTQRELQILIDYYGVLPTGQIVAEFLPNRTRSVLKHKARQLGLSANRSAMTSKAKKLYSVNSEYFNGDDLEVFYWAGFLAADGCITSDDRLQLGVASQDIEHLKRFKRTLRYNGTITTSHGGRYHTVRIRDKVLIESLKMRFNLVQRKSLILQPPTCFQSRGQVVAFAVGYIDGDGCIHKNKDGRIELSCLGTLHMMKWIRSVFFPQLNTHIAKRNKIYRFKITGQYALDIIDQVKRLKLPALKRKWCKV